MSRTACKSVAVLCCVGLLVQGCGWVEDHPKTAAGAGIGAVGGAILGGAARGKRGAVVGGLVGALAGGLIGNYLDRKDKAAQETNQAYSYAPTQGTRLEIIAAAAEPATVAPGGKVSLQVTYALMAPQETAQVPVVETRTLTFNGAKVAELNSNVNRTPGTYTSQVPVDLRADAPKGQYELTVTVAAAGQTAQRSASFTVN